MHKCTGYKTKLTWSTFFRSFSTHGVFSCTAVSLLSAGIYMLNDDTVVRTCGKIKSFFRMPGRTHSWSLYLSEHYENVKGTRSFGYWWAAINSFFGFSNMHGMLPPSGGIMGRRRDPGLRCGSENCWRWCGTLSMQNYLNRLKITFAPWMPQQLVIPLRHVLDYVTRNSSVCSLHVIIQWALEALRSKHTHTLLCASTRYREQTRTKRQNTTGTASDQQDRNAPTSTTWSMRWSYRCVYGLVMFSPWTETHQHRQHGRWGEAANVYMVWRCSPMGRNSHMLPWNGHHWAHRY